MKINLKDKTFREILAFSLIPFGTSTIYGIMSTALNLYFTDVLGLSLAMTSIILSATRIWDAVNDPIMGMIVDKTHTKMGKCRPYILWMTAPVILATALLFAPVNFGQKGNFIYAIVRECCGDKLILGCGVPLMPAFGKVDYCRIGSDISLICQSSYSAKFIQFKFKIRKL